MRNSGQAAFKAIVVLATLCLLLASFAGKLWWEQRARGGAPVAVTPGAERTSRGPATGGPGAAATGGSDPSGVIAGLVAAGNGLWDSHPDADVARVLQPGLKDRNDLGVSVSSNAFGMRERDYALPKPAGTLRVVLLGDSFVYGMGVAAEQRLGRVLEAALRERAGPAARALEVLHLGVTSWDIVAECAYVRRQLSLLQPDLVVHFVVPNDLDDTVGVRGMGLLARQTPRHPEQADTVISMTFGRWALNPQSKGLLPWALDDEGQGRLAECGSQLAHLAQLVEAQGGRYLLVVNWQAFAGVAAEGLASRLRPEQVAWMPLSFYRDNRYRISAEDEHWNAAGHVLVGQALYGWIAERKLLPQLTLPAWPEADALARQWNTEGEGDAQRPDALLAQRRAVHARSALDLAQLDPVSAGQVNGGIFKDGSVSPTASLLLARDGGASLHVTGQCLPRPELEGASVQVLVDREPVGSFPLHAGARIDLSVPLPEASRGHEWVSVRFVASDFVYAGADLRQCVAFRLQRAAIEP